MFSIKRILAIVNAGAILVSVATCGGETVGGDSDKKEIPFQTWNFKSDKYTPYSETLIKAYKKDHPDVTVKWLDAPSDGYEDKLSSRAAAGELPDIVDGGNSILYGLAKAGTLFDVSKQAPGAEKDYYEGVWKSVTMQGNGVERGAYDLPWYVNNGPAYWNTELMQRYGLDSNKIPTTWDEYFAAGDTIVQNCRGVYLGATMGYDTEGPTTTGVESFMNDDYSRYTFNDEAGVKQTSHFVELYKKGSIPPETLDFFWSQAVDLFQRGNLVSMAGSAYSIDGFRQNAPDLYKNFAVGPRISNNSKSTSVTYKMLGIGANSKHPNVAIDFARFVANEKNQIEFDKKASVFPSAKGGLDDNYYKSIDESTLGGKALKIALDQVKNDYGSRSAEFTDNNGYKNFQQQIVLAVQDKQAVKEALDKSVGFTNEKLA